MKWNKEINKRKTLTKKVGYTQTTRTRIENLNGETHTLKKKSQNKFVQYFFLLNLDLKFVKLVVNQCNKPTNLQAHEMLVYGLFKFPASQKTTCTHCDIVDGDGDDEDGVSTQNIRSVVR